MTLKLRVSQMRFIRFLISHFTLSSKQAKEGRWSNQNKMLRLDFSVGSLLKKTSTISSGFDIE
jgi:hypothetical protein